MRKHDALGRWLYELEHFGYVIVSATPACAKDALATLRGTGAIVKQQVTNGSRWRVADPKAVAALAKQLRPDFDVREYFTENHDILYGKRAQATPKIRK